MRAVVYHAPGDIRLEEVPEPAIQRGTDAIVGISASALCGTDLHLVRGSLGLVEAGTILGHEGVGIVEALGNDVRNFAIGDRVVIAPTIGCGWCAYCREGYYSQCDHANPRGPRSGPALFGGPERSGPFDGLHAEHARIPHANVGLVRIPEEVSDEQALLVCDLFASGWFAARLAQIEAGETVGVFGCGPTGLFAIMSAFMQGAGRVIAVDCESSRLSSARALGAEVVSFEEEAAVPALLSLTGGIGVDRVIDAVGVDALHAHRGPGLEQARKDETRFHLELADVRPRAADVADWHPGDAPSQSLEWAVKALAKGGTLAIVGSYPPTFGYFPIGLAVDRNLTIQAGVCNHRKYIPRLLDMVKSRTVDPARLVSHREPLMSAVDAYHALAQRQPGWLMVELTADLVPLGG